MFEAAELGRKVSSDDYKAQVPALREELLEVQRQLRDDPILGHHPVWRRGRRRQERERQPAERVDGSALAPDAGLRSAVGRRARAARVLAVLARPAAAGPHRVLPERLVLASARRSRPPPARAAPSSARSSTRSPTSSAAHRRRRAHPEVLDAPRQASQKARLKKLEKDPLTRWRVTPEQWRNFKLYGRFIDAAEEIITRTSLANAPWTIVEGGDERYRSLTLATHIRDAIRKRLAESPASPSRSPATRHQRAKPRRWRRPRRRARRARQPTILSQLDMFAARRPEAVQGQSWNSFKDG